MDRLETMRIFVTVVNRQGFAVAARELGLAVATVSKAVTALETHLGVSLLNRTTRRMNVSADGARYYDWCCRILADCEEAETMVRHNASEPGGRIRIAAPMLFGQNHLIHPVTDFMRRYPGMVVELDLNDRYVDLVAEGFDLAVRIGRLGNSSLRSRKLATFGLQVCASPDHLARHGIPATPEDLTTHPCLVYTLSSREEVGVWRFEDAESGKRHRIRVTGVLFANNGEVLRQAALAGLGVTILPSFHVEADLASGKLQQILANYRLQGGGIHAVYQPSRLLPVRVRLFIDHLVEQWRHGIGARETTST
ncbi:MAG: LysR family transcriptional regulator [Magnetococcales bacterium]|nr:LysR family transcriptional regulator [Magnetococcales bacterium]